MLKRLFLVPFFFVALLGLTLTLLNLKSKVYAADPPAVTCTFDGNPSRPGGNCAQTVPYVNSNIDDYSKSATSFNLACPVNPEVFPDVSSCESPPTLFNAQEPTENEEEWNQDGLMPVTYLTDFAKLTVGGLGPDTPTYQGAPPDNQARVYPYSGLADKPIDLKGDIPREAFRTFWRLSTLRQQLEVRAAFFKRFVDQTPPIFNAELPYATPSAQAEGGPDIYSGPRQAISPQGLRADMEEFFGKGASGYLMWQYSGDQGTGEVFENDQYSIFASDANFQEYCQVFKDFSSRGLVGVNVWSAANFVDRPSVIQNQFGKLAACGVNTIRVFASTYVDPANAAAQAAKLKQLLSLTPSGIKLIIAVGDYSNGSIGLPGGADASWYQSGYKGAYRSFAQTVASAVAGDPHLYGLELANEPHCGGQPDSTIGLYAAWGQDVGSILRGASPNVGYGQMAVPGGVCDDPGGSDGFSTTNKIGPITMTSGHYYDTGMRNNSLLALEKSKALGKPFYIGEAGGGAATNPLDYPTYTIKDLVNDLPDCLKTYPLPQTCGLFKAFGITVGEGLIGKTPEDAYRELETANPELKAKYDAFQPFDFDNLRNYIALFYKDVPPDSKSQNYFAGTGYQGDNRHVGVLAENVPYIQALNDILNNSLSFGVLSALSPEFINSNRQTELTPDQYFLNLTYPTGNTNPDAPEDLAPLKQDFLNKESGSDLTVLYNNEKIYRLIGQDAIDIWQRDLASGVAGCFDFDPEGPSLPAPSTSPDKLPHQTTANSRSGEIQAHWEPTVKEPNVSSINQMVYVPVHTTGNKPKPEYITQSDGTVKVECNNGCSATPEGYCPTHYFTHYNPSAAGTHHPLSYTASPWVYDSVGRAIAVFNNPKLTDFSNMVSNGVNSLYKMLLPSNLLAGKTTFKAKSGESELPMLADQAQYSSSNTDVKIDVDGKRGKGGGSATATAPVSREGGQAEVDLCRLRNFWLRPSSLQAGIPSDCEDLEKYLMFASPAQATNAVPNACTTQNSGFKSQEVLNIIANAGAYYHVPPDVLASVLYIEGGCRGNPNDSTTICNVDDSTVKQYSAPGAQFPRNCSVGGIFTFLSGEWPKWSSAINKATGSTHTPNVCNIKDSIYAAAWELSAGANACPQEGFPGYTSLPTTWTDDMKENAVTSWAAGCLVTDCGSGGPGYSDPTITQNARDYAKIHCDAVKLACTQPSTPTSPTTNQQTPQ